MELWEKLVQGDEIACARAISIVENEREGYVDLLKNIHSHTGHAYVIGFTGPPGAGKSTLVDKVVKQLRKADQKVGIIAVDPTSPFSKGAILGDRIRMNDLNLDPGVFIRSMGTRGSLGGLSKATQGAIKILDAYGCDYILIETVGVGQSEIDIVKTVDTVVMVMVPGLGDDIQAIKAGIMEIGDVFVINKSDRDGAKKAKLEIEMMLDFNKDWAFRPPVSMAIASNDEGIEELLDNISNHKEYLMESGKIEDRRLNRERAQIEQYIDGSIDKILEEKIKAHEDDIHASLQGEKDPYTIGKEILLEITGGNYEF